MQVLSNGRAGICSVGFCGERKTRRKTQGVSQEPITKSTHIWNRARIEPGTHWREASVLTTAPSLLQIKIDVHNF